MAAPYHILKTDLAQHIDLEQPCHIYQDFYNCTLSGCLFAQKCKFQKNKRKYKNNGFLIDERQGKCPSGGYFSPFDGKIVPGYVLFQNQDVPSFIDKHQLQVNGPLIQISLQKCVEYCDFEPKCHSLVY